MSPPKSAGGEGLTANNVLGSSSIAELFCEAQKQHQAQRFQDAERGYRAILDKEPAHLEAWYHFGLVCMAQNKLNEADIGFQRVLALSPNHVDALTDFGIVMARQNRLADAIATFQRAIALKPDYAKAHNNLGVAFAQLGRKEEALACHHEATRLQPDYAEAHFNLAVCYGERRQSSEAIASFERALQIRPNFPDALFYLGMLLVEERRPAEAIIYLEQAVRLVPNNHEAHNNLSLVLADLGRFEEAVACCDAALRIQPFDPKAHMNRGNVLAALGRTDEAVANYDFALRLQPEYANASWNRSLAFLSQGDFQRGWREYEWRWKKPETKTRTLPEPRWDGSQLDGKTILLWCEQGIGDTIQFVRYASELKNRGATVWVECPEGIAELLAKCRGVDRVFLEGVPLPAGFDCHAPMMSLPFLCGTTLDKVPAAIPYICSDPNAISRWRTHLGRSSKLKIGVTWQGNPKYRFDRHRSFSVQWFRPIALMEGVEVYSLQKGLGIEQLQTTTFPIIDLRPKLDEQGGDFLQTAAAIQALDLIITCDSSVAHLAGAFGTPVWVAMSMLSDWRWLRDREDSPWYPTMRLFRQSRLGDWASVFARILDEVRTIRDRQERSARAPITADKIIEWPALLAWRESARAAGKTIVWTNGCFDLLHVGHIRNLAAARALGDLLVVGVNSDASVERLKGDGRPIVPGRQRAEILAALACVDHVIVFDEDNPVEAIRRLHPDVHCKGADYAPPNGKPIPEAAVVASYGGRIEFLPMVNDASTSYLIERILGERISNLTKHLPEAVADGDETSRIGC